jgi:(p)ppGpp synthase/HD superfamily hydrolase
MSELRPDAANANELVAAELVAAELNDSVVHGEDLMPEVDALVQHGIAVGIATIAHRGQLDKLGDDYVDHPARVAENFDWLNEPVEHCTAWLHDVIEDTDISASDLLKAGMLPEIVAAVELLTRRADVADADYYDRIRQHPAASGSSRGEARGHQRQPRRLALSQTRPRHPSAVVEQVFSGTAAVAADV